MRVSEFVVMNTRTSSEQSNYTPTSFYSDGQNDAGCRFPAPLFQPRPAVPGCASSRSSIPASSTGMEILLDLQLFKLQVSGVFPLIGLLFRLIVFPLFFYSVCHLQPSFSRIDNTLAANFCWSDNHIMNAISIRNLFVRTMRALTPVILICLSNCARFSPLSV